MKQEVKLPYDPAIHAGYIPKGIETNMSKTHLYTQIHYATIRNCQDMQIEYQRMICNDILIYYSAKRVMELSLTT